MGEQHHIFPRLYDIHIKLTIFSSAPLTLFIRIIYMALMAAPLSDNGSLQKPWRGEIRSFSLFYKVTQTVQDTSQTFSGEGIAVLKRHSADFLIPTALSSTTNRFALRKYNQVNCLICSMYRR